MCYLNAVLISLLLFVACDHGLSCELESYKSWFKEIYDQNESESSVDFEFYKDVAEITREETKLWRVLDLDNNSPNTIQLTNGQVMELASARCRDALSLLTLNSAGKFHPIDESEQHVHDTMCSKYCLVTDRLREEAMKLSRCSCLELSTQRNNLLYHKTGDFCHANSGRILCNEKIEWCGIWGCSLEDFHCPRREYNRKYIPFRGNGWECGSGIMNLPLSPAHLFAGIIVGLFVLL
mmetsp:Transcript_25110/g.37545  ORF Transcript_25110/g.37545 Transcript_25110/m.37545 type:complete len:237 (+) Transcript_25110:259-969(+)